MEYFARTILTPLKKRPIRLVVGLLLCAHSVFAQNANFGKPLKIPLELSASFAELRGNHFHGGLDFKTQQREGLPVYAVADGTLSRVVVSSVGYGKALYVVHNNGMMSVYGHLSKFIPFVERVVREQQYAKKSFELDINFPEPLHFKKGDLIGYSGNSGSSGGPHLHFELRNRGGENALNPAFYGYAVKDDMPPEISTLAIYPNDHHSLVEGQQTPLMLPVVCGDSECVATLDTIRIFGHFAFGIEAIDKTNGSANELGLYSLKFFINNDLKFAWKLDAVRFSQTRYINAFIDYAHYNATGKRIQWTHRLPGNRLNIYEKAEHRGVFPFFQNGAQNLRIEAADAAGNTSVLNAVLMVEDTMKLLENPDFQAQTIDHKRIFSHVLSNTFQNKQIKVVIPAAALYEPIYFDYTCDSVYFDGEKLTDIPNIYSNIHHVHHSITPLHTNYNLKIKTVNLPKNLENKALIASWNASKNAWSAEGGKFAGGYVSLNIRKFSIFAVCVDTTQPTIEPIDVRNHNVPISQNELTFKIKDDFSGIGNYVASIDGRWFLMEYDAKTQTLKGTINKLIKGEHELKLTVSDKKNNTTIYKAKIIR